jgi:hypothetical protein
MDFSWTAGAAIAAIGAMGAPAPVSQDATPPPPAASAPQETPAAPAAPAPQEPATSPPPAYEPRYHRPEEIGALVAAWIATASADTVRAEAVELPATGTGLPVPALAFGAGGPIPLAERPTVLLVGGLDGVSLAGSEAVLAACAAYFANPSLLPRDVAFLAIPCASPEALAETLSGRGGSGADRTPLDDDGDGAVDEDGPDDLDGDGKILDMLIEDPAGSWARGADPRFLAPARPGDAPRYELSREGRDDDHDGRYDEDPAGGVVFDRSFPVGWKPDNPLARGTLLPLEVPACRAIADLALSRRVALVLLFQGNYGGVARPGARAESPWGPGADDAAFEVAGRLFAHATGRAAAPPATLIAARGGERPGAALDWFYAVPGALALEVAPWGPGVEKPGEASGVGLAEALFENAARGPGARHVAPPVSASDLAWGRWLDNTRGGIGFVDWHPVELGDGRQGLVGGWEPLSRSNPPEKSLGLALIGMPEFVQSLAAALPALDLRVAEARRDGDVCTIRARVANLGALPCGGATSGRSAAARGEAASAGARLEIELPTGARLIAGESSVALGEIAGGGASREVGWIVLAPPGSVLTLRAGAPWTGPVALEVKP